MRNFPASRFVLASLFGAVLFFALDSLHVQAGIWVATHARGVPWWFVFVYFAGISAAQAAFVVIERRHTLRPALLFEVTYFALVLAAHLTLFRVEWLLAVVCFLLLGGRLVWRRAPGDLAVVAAVIALDLVAELGLLAAGRFHYAYTAYGPLPLWLTPMWGALGLSLRRFARAVALGARRLGRPDGTAYSGSLPSLIPSKRIVER